MSGTGEYRAIRLPAGHPPVKAGRIGVLLVNLGTPDGTDYWSMRRYLKEFLSDRRVIEVNRLIWWPLLNLVILSTRPQRSGEAYRSIWNEERNESPLRTITRAQAEKLAARFGGETSVVVDWAMRYGNPSIASRLAALKAEGCERILIVPLYPQYSAATTATVNDKAFEALMAMRWQPAVRTLPPYHDDPAYIDALARETEAALGRLDFEPEVILASFHGLPREYLDKGDPYHCQCHKTVRLLKARLGPLGDKVRLTFQSRFGRAEWLQPYTDETVKTLADQGIKRLAVITPGFAADCVETLEEIAGQNAEFFHEHGGEKFAALPCLNDGAPGMAMLESLVRRELAGWL
ncbi:ferrochelatase [Prosthecomicrobium pneumaticum]|uniref:Ferrochelatase n=1 Tax=Prosthecomicrobium pneumaticum TaxID=81895 RepID=A0A7W9CVV4_9HYPH|nr:ferrochelatase [Prosthecomicrobium pneumaticum]MBB5752521.1 ferrochelatase [Prosthecomicrobium pneumaticum]